MYGKILALILFCAGLGMVLLGMRQQRLELMHEIAGLFDQIHDHRHRLWDLQVKTAMCLERQKLLGAIDRAGLELEPDTPAGVERVEGQLVAGRLGYARDTVEAAADR